MAAQVRDAVADIEIYRLQLEANVEKLRKALQHWQTWEAEYEGLKEEIQTLPENASSQELGRAASGLQGTLVNEKETNEILGLDKGNPRKTPQIVSLLDRRIDYVHKNVTTMQKQFDAAELKLLNVEAVKQEILNEDGLPLTEINEELDEDGNVISAAVSHPGESSDTVLEVLKKVGIDEEELKNDDGDAEDKAPKAPNAAIRSPGKVPRQLHPLEGGEAEPPLPKKQKSVTFSPEAKAVPQPVPTFVASEVQPAKSKPLTPTVPGITNLAAGSFPQHARVIELDENDLPIAVNAPVDPVRNPIIPPNESEEDTRLRREMLQYSMSEVGAVVAQLDLEERGSDESEFSDENYDIDEEDAEDYDYDGTSASEGDEDEDEHGLSRRSYITAGYKKQMEDLEKKLRGQVFANLGPRPPPEVLDAGLQVSDDDEAAEKVAADARNLRIQRVADGSQPDSDTTGTALAGKAKKGVRFAEELDVAPDPTSAKTAGRTNKSKAASGPIRDRVQERSSLSTAPPDKADPARKQSRFKAARATPSSTASNQPGPANDQPLADVVIERTCGNTQAKPPSKNNPEILQKQLGMEYVRQRNNMIYQQGGFMKEGTREEDADIDADEDASGRPIKKMSRFMAARVRDT